MTIVIRGSRPEDRADWLRMRRALWDECPDDEHERKIDEIAASEDAGSPEATMTVAVRIEP